MNRQRFSVFIVAIIGMIATFLPWYGTGAMSSISGMGSSGWFTFIMFVLVLFVGLRKDIKEDMTMGMVWGASAFALLASFVVLWRAIDIFFAKEELMSLGGNLNGVPASQVSVMYGAWIVMLAGLCVPLAAVLFRDHSFRRD